MLIACTSNDEVVNDTVSIEDVMGEVEELDVKAETEVVDAVQSMVSDGSKLSNLMVSLQSEYDTLNLSTPHKMDRYGYNTSKKIKFISTLGGSDSFIDVYQYNFSDSIKLNNAFYNWLDCYGNRCSEIKIGEDIERTQNAPALTLVYDTTIVSVKYSSELDKISLNSFQDSMFIKFGDQYRYAILTNRRGDLNWK